MIVLHVEKGGQAPRDAPNPRRCRWIGRSQSPFFNSLLGLGHLFAATVKMHARLFVATAVFGDLKFHAASSAAVLIARFRRGQSFINVGVRGHHDFLLLTNKKLKSGIYDSSPSYRARRIFDEL